MQLISRIGLILFIFIVLGCQKTRQYVLSEQMVNHYLHAENARMINYIDDIDHLNINFFLGNLNVDIGRNMNKDISASCIAKVTLYSPQGNKNIDIIVKLSGKPKVNSGNGTIHLSAIDVTQYQIEDNDNDNGNVNKLVPHLNQMMAVFFEKYPIYLADNSSFIERQAFVAPKFTIEKGQLLFSL